MLSMVKDIDLFHKSFKLVQENLPYQYLNQYI